MHKSFLFLLLFFLGSLPPLSAQFSLPKIWSDSLVIQRDRMVPVWGRARPGTVIEVAFRGATYRSTTNPDGEWQVDLAPAPAGGPYELTVRGPDSVRVLRGILAGDVWVCSGQSNMEWRVASSNDAEREVAQASYPRIRLFGVPDVMAASPQTDLEGGQWTSCYPGAAADFSAVGYFFGRDLHRTLDVPIGLINSSWGGTVAETWISREGLHDPEMMVRAGRLSSLDFRQEQERIRRRAGAWRAGLTEKDEGREGDHFLWIEEGTDYDSWKPIAVPGLWEGVGEETLRSFDGVVWFSREFVLNEREAGQAAVLSLGPIDDSDITWVNGVEVGAMTQAYDRPRRYDIPAGILRPGTNRIVVRVEDTGGGGGLYGDAGMLFLQAGSRQIGLSGGWAYRIGTVDLGPSPDASFGPNSFPTLLYNGMIHPLIRFPIRGVIWYQGEANADRAMQYRQLFKDLILDWRKQWGYDFPFLYVLLANYRSPVDQPGRSTWAELREAQLMAGELPLTGAASAIDIGEADDIHPRNKQEVGRRLALAAKRVAYDLPVQASGPVVDQVSFRAGAAYVSFREVGGGLTVHDKYGYLKGFTLAGKDQKFCWAKAEIVDERTVKVYAASVPDPVAVRYAWSDNPDQANLYNAEGLPANPFRMDAR